MLESLIVITGVHTRSATVVATYRPLTDTFRVTFRIHSVTWYILICSIEGIAVPDNTVYCMVVVTVIVFST